MGKGTLGGGHRRHDRTLRRRRSTYPGTPGSAFPSEFVLSVEVAYEVEESVVYLFGRWSLSPVNRHPGTGQDSNGREIQDARRPLDG
jgi:hypothetical protein